MGKIETLSTHNLFCWKFAVSVGKLLLSAVPTVLTHNAAVYLTG